MKNRLFLMTPFVFVIAACSEGTTARVSDTGVLRGDFLIGSCRSIAGSAPAYDFTVAVDAEHLPSGSWSAKAMVVRGVIDSRQFNMRAAVKRVVYNYDLEFGADSYVGVSHFRFVTGEAAEAARGVGLVFRDNASNGNFQMELSDRMVSSLQGIGANCVMSNRAELLARLESGSW